MENHKKLTLKAAAIIIFILCLSGFFMLTSAAQADYFSDDYTDLSWVNQPMQYAVWDGATRIQYAGPAANAEIDPADAGLGTGLIYLLHLNADTTPAIGDTAAANGNAAPSVSDSKFGGGSYGFDGAAGSKIQLNGGNPAIIEDLSNFSVSMWAKSNITKPTNGLLLCAYVNSNWVFCSLGNAPNQNFGGIVRTNNITLSSHADGAAVFNDTTTWHHIALVFGGAINVYVDGALWTKGPNIGGVTPTGGSGMDFEIGSSFNGNIDEFAIWNRALDLSEIQQLAGKIPQGSFTSKSIAMNGNKFTPSWTASNNPIVNAQFSKDGVNFYPSAPFALTNGVTIYPADAADIPSWLKEEPASFFKYQVIMPKGNESIDKFQASWQDITDFPPVADAGADQVIRVANDITSAVVTVDGSNSEDGYPYNHTLSYEWSDITNPQNPAALGNQAVISHTFSLGIYTVKLKVTSNTGDISEDTAVITVKNSTPLASFTTRPLSGNTFTGFAFDGSPSTSDTGTLKIYEWDFDYGGNFTSDEADDYSHRITEHIYSTAGQHRTALRVTDDAGITSAAVEGPVVTVVDPAQQNSAPAITTPSVSTAPETSPATGDTATPFYFKVTYSDADNNTAKPVTLILSDGTTDTRYPLVKRAWWEHDYTAGIEYHVSNSGIKGLRKNLHYSFRVEVSDGIVPVYSSATIDGPTVNNAAPVPVINGGSAILCGQTMTLDASGSYDPDHGDSISLQWAQTGGVPVALNSPTSSKISFNAPNAPGTLIFALTLTDNDATDPKTTVKTIDIIVESASNTYYVSNAGNDTNPGTIDQPFNTIRHATSIARSGDTIYLRKGEYTEKDITFPYSGHAGMPITISAFLGEEKQAILQENAEGKVGGRSIFAMDDLDRQTPGYGNYVFKNLIMRNAGNVFSFASESARVHDVLIENIDFYNCDTAVKASYMGVERFVIRDIYEHDCYNDDGPFNFQVNSSPSMMTVPGSGSRNVIIRNVEGGYNPVFKASTVIVQEQCENFILLNNTEYNNAQYGFASKAGGHNIWLNNIAYNNGKGAYYLGGPFKDYTSMGYSGVQLVASPSNYILLNNIGIGRHVVDGGAIVMWWPAANVWLYGNTIVQLLKSGAMAPLTSLSGASGSPVDPYYPYQTNGFSKNNIFYSAFAGTNAQEFDVVLNDAYPWPKRYLPDYNLYGGWYRIIGVNADGSIFSANPPADFDDWKNWFLQRQGDVIDAHSIDADPQFINLDPENDTVFQDLKLQSTSPAKNAGAPYSLTDPNDYPSKIEEFLKAYSPDHDPDTAFSEFSILEDTEKQELRDYIRNAYKYDRDGNLRDVAPDIGAYEYAPDQGEPIAGDVNDDKAVDVLDVQACVNIILGVNTNLGDIERAKRVQDPPTAGVDVTNLQAIVNKILGV